MTAVAVIIALTGGVLVLNVAAHDQQVRLVNGGTPFEGRVEVFYQGVWGTICYPFWDLDEANVVCRQLGYEKALAAPRDAAFGEGTGKIWLDSPRCSGSENSISNCSHSGWGNVHCGHDEDVSVICAVPVKLIGGPSPKEGLVQVYHNNIWGSVCDQMWDAKDSDVVCRTLGYTGSTQPNTKADYGQGSPTMWLNNVQCAGNESSIFSCTHDGLKMHACTNGNKANVSCVGTHVRLANGSSPFEGRVEVLYEGVWGTVCDRRGELDNAKVVCRQLGYGPALAALERAAFGEGKGHIWWSRVQCQGNENYISECPHRGDGRGCDHGDDASVICSAPVRLVGGSHLREGIVQVYVNDTWGSVCDQMWDKKDADVACRMLGYTGSNEEKNGAFYGKGSDTLWLSNLQCTGNEDWLFSCVHDGLRNHTCAGGKEATVFCLGPDVRLADGGTQPSVGRVEYLYSGVWGAVCDDRWDTADANVVCRELGYPDAVSAPRNSQFGLGSGAGWINDVECTGNENSITQCSHSGWGKANCKRDFASVICSLPVRLIGGPSDKEGLVEVYYDNTWGHICDENWDKKDADVFCRALGYTGSADSKSNAFYGSGNGVFWLNNVQCAGDEDSIFSCAHDGLKKQGCPNGEVAKAVCVGSEVRLVGPEPFLGRVELLYRGLWGTVCSDSLPEWNLQSANIVCRQLGFKDALAAPRCAPFGPGDLIIWLDGTSCKGSEHSLADCGRDWGHSKCSHIDDVGVVCRPQGK
ncbi:scavenger receptor cysteine-rich domain-containing protein DMBT1-like isoform X1 [Oculina patagonica]